MFAEQIIERCKCVSGDMSFTLSQFASVNYTVCGNQTSPVDGSLSMTLEGFLGLFCSYSLELDVVSCNEQCLWPCFEYQYDTSSTQSHQWPHIAYQLAFYDIYIKNRTYADKFDAYEDISVALKNGAISTVGNSRLVVRSISEKNYSRLTSRHISNCWYSAEAIDSSESLLSLNIISIYYCNDLARTQIHVHRKIYDNVELN
jgi:Amiloride-sensitive sodium channel